MKFGGTSVGDGKKIANVARLVKEDPRKKVVVVSALGGITDKMVNFANSVVNLPNTVIEEEVDRFYNEILVQHTKAAEDSIEDEHILEGVITNMVDLANKLKIALLGVGYLEDLSAQ